MADEVQDRQQQPKRAKRKRLGIAVGVTVALILALVVPPLVNLNHFQTRVAHLMAASLGRPVRLSRVGVRLLPRPALVLTDLTVEEDPAYGAEPVLHANTVVAPIRILSLWRGKLELARINVDEASVNLVRTADGRWNLDALLGRAAQAGAESGVVLRSHLPYLRATNSRINVKVGAEKLPFSLTDTNLSLWQDQPGQWRLELKGAPSRTDLALNQGDTGIVELSATAKSGAQLRQMPIKLDLEWRNAQIGQLTRLLIGRDPGWRGDLRGELHVEGTADAAQVKTRLRAAGVHRAEFAPASPLDFDANCGFVYHYSAHTVEKLSCESPLGSGRVKLTGELPGNAPAQLTAELDKIPVDAGLNVLRTLRNNIPVGLEAAGTVSGRIAYAEPAAELTADPAAARQIKAKKPEPAIVSPLSGSLIVEGFQLSGAGLNQPLKADKIVLAAAQGRPVAVAGTATFDLGAPTPLEASFRLGVHGFQVGLHGAASVARTRELAHASGLKGATLLDALAGDPLTADLTAAEPWMPADETGAALDDSLFGTLVLRNANWKSDALVNHVQIAQATLHLGGGQLRWDPIAFTYGPLKGTATVSLPVDCQDCAPHVEAQFAELDAETAQAALLGAHTKGTLLSELIDKFHPAAQIVWPHVDAVLKADAFKLGPTTLHKVNLNLAINATGAEISAFDGELLGGHLHLTGSVKAGDKPAYDLKGSVEQLNPAAMGQLLGERWSGGQLDLSGNLTVAGYSADDLASSAKGALHLDWKKGAAAGTGVPPALARFERWTAQAAIGSGSIVLRQNDVTARSQKSAVEGSVSLTLPAKASFVLPAEAHAKR
jgi:hypothetical protein